jgi:hypothetical protein
MKTEIISSSVTYTSFDIFKHKQHNHEFIKCYFLELPEDEKLDVNRYFAYFVNVRQALGKHMGSLIKMNKKDVKKIESYAKLKKIDFEKVVCDSYNIFETTFEKNIAIKALCNKFEFNQIDNNNV